jgi:hypothetical protein
MGAELRAVATENLTQKGPRFWRLMRWIAAFSLENRDGDIAIRRLRWIASFRPLLDPF